MSTVFESMKIGLASPDQIREWSYGIVERPETINYRTQKPEKDGLFCERIFGPQKDWECSCGRYKRIRFNGKVCERCGVEVTRNKVRRERMGHIELAAPVSHIWYFKGTPSRIGQILDISPKRLEEVLYFTKYIVIDSAETEMGKGTLLSEKEYSEMKEKYPGDGEFYAQMGAEAIKELLSEYSYDRFDKYISENIGAFSEITGLSRLEIENYIARRNFFIEAVPADVDEAHGYTKYETCYTQGQIITRKIYEEIIVPLNIRRRKLNQTELTIKSGSDYIIELYDRAVAGGTLEGDDVILAESISSEYRKNNIDYVAEELKSQIQEAGPGQKQIKLLKRLDVIEAFRHSHAKPEWMTLSAVPVIPPDIRPMVLLDGGRFATSDLNDLYRRVINRNNRLYKMIELRAPEIIIRNEKRMLQEAVDALIDNGRHGRPVTGPNNRPLKSLSDMLKGKQGRFRQNLLGKRVDYSGRSVIVVGPDLKMNQCGLPKEMAIELFKPFVMRELCARDPKINIKSARKMVERAKDEVWEVLDSVIANHPVLLNRAPTLHRLGIQAFMPVLVEGRALKLHPLVCTAYNADFDGDQMAVHLPLSNEAQNEARELMLASNNLLKPSDGRPVAVPTQDMVLGSYYLTLDKKGEKGENKVFRDFDEAIMAYQSGDVTLHSRIKVRVNANVNGRSVTRIIPATVGKIIFNERIPQDLGFVDRTDPAKAYNLEIDFKVGKKQLGQIIDKCIKIHGTKPTSEVLDNIKALGFKYSTKAAITVAVFDAVIPPKKKEILEQADNYVSEVNEFFSNGYMSNSERKQELLNIWNNATEEVSSALTKNLDEFNPIFMMADSGARGSINQIRQLAGMRGLIANTSGETIEIPIRANYREGLNILEYFISSRGARKGLADTALRTADSGYLTRRLVDVSQEVIIRYDDCGTTNGIEVFEIREGGEKIEPLTERLTGRYLTEDFVHPETGVVIVKHNHIINDDDAKHIVETGVKTVKIRSVLTCESRNGVCAKCYGASLANGAPIKIGEAVGIIAAQSIGEPGTQLTMRTFHTGGIANADDITQGLPRVEELFESRNPKAKAIVAEISGTVRFEEIKKIRHVTVVSDTTSADGSAEGIPVEIKHPVPFSYRLKVEEGDKVRTGDPITEGSLSPFDVLRTRGEQAVQNYVIAEVQKVYRSQGVDINDKHIEVIVRQMMRKMKVIEPGDSGLLMGATIDKNDVFRVLEEMRIRSERGDVGGGISDITISSVHGISSEDDDDYDTDKSDTADKDDDAVKVSSLTDGDIVDGVAADGNISVSGGNNSNLADVSAVTEEETEIGAPYGGVAMIGNLVAPKFEPILLGITKASLATDSFLSAASFQETTRVLTDAAIHGKIDPLLGLKENVIIGKLIPAGTGMNSKRVLERVAAAAEAVNVQ